MLKINKQQNFSINNFSKFNKYLLTVKIKISQYAKRDGNNHPANYSLVTFVAFSRNIIDNCRYMNTHIRSNRRNSNKLEIYTGMDERTVKV